MLSKTSNKRSKPRRNASKHNLTALWEAVPSLRPPNPSEASPACAYDDKHTHLNPNEPPACFNQPIRWRIIMSSFLHGGSLAPGRRPITLSIVFKRPLTTDQLISSHTHVNDSFTNMMNVCFKGTKERVFY